GFRFSVTMSLATSLVQSCTWFKGYDMFQRLPRVQGHSSSDGHLVKEPLDFKDSLSLDIPQV
ncbi:hypothetical protein Tco_0313477, partial [Tanacetum coccineum]